MSKFNDGLGSFLLDYRNTALDELKNNPVYDDWLAKRNALQAKIESQVGAESFEDFTEALLATHSMEMNTALMCGVTFYCEIGKRLDSTSPESKELAKSILG